MFLGIQKTTAKFSPITEDAFLDFLPPTRRPPRGPRSAGRPRKHLHLKPSVAKLLQRGACLSDIARALSIPVASTHRLIAEVKQGI